MNFLARTGPALLLCCLVAPAAADRPRRQCEEHRLSVSLAAGAPTAYSVAGELCWVGSVPPGALQVLVHGALYNRVYWDFPYQAPRYSYARLANHAGYATFNLDRIGAGASDRPPASEVTVDSNAHVLHQVLQALRTGALGAHRFARIVLVGHSFGSIIAVTVASRFPADLDGLILTGYAHNLAPMSGTPDPSAFWPPEQDPHFAGQSFPPGYLTTTPGTRGALFYHLPNADPAVIALDESTKDTFTPALDLTRALSFESRAIGVPVLEVLGEHDGIFCGGNLNCSDPAAVQASEAAYYSPPARLRTVIVPGSGHLLGLERTSLLASAVLLAWSASNVPPTSRP
jgi:pimeloyl-ACP methyl ester carboxylesterase